MEPRLTTKFIDKEHLLIIASVFTGGIWKVAGSIQSHDENGTTIFSDWVEVEAIDQMDDGVAKLLLRLAELEEERKAIVASLRILCEEYGTNNWPDNLWLPDAIEKNLGRYLHESDV